MELRKIDASENEFVKPIVDSFMARSKSLPKNDARLGALYVDPRFNFQNSVYLNEQDKIKARVINGKF
jgi:hypothetical protein